MKNVFIYCLKIIPSKNYLSPLRKCRLNFIRSSVSVPLAIHLIPLAFRNK